MSSTSKRKPTPEEIAQIKARIAGLSHAEKVALAARTAPILEKRGKKKVDDANNKPPQTDDELHAAIIRETGFTIPRVAVCEDHCAPFDLVADGFFHRVAGILNLKSREAGGTLNASILQYVLCKYVPGHEGVQLGSIRDQAEKAFSYVKQFTEERIENEDGTFTKRIKPEIDGEPLQKRIAWLCGSLLQIIIASIRGVNSPHPNTVHADEVDLMTQEVIDQSNNMSSSTLLPNGTRIPALDLVVSTRKSMLGPMQKLIKEVEKAKADGYEASYEIYAYCVFEIAEEVSECRSAPAEQREARLKDLGRDPCELCDCDRVVKSEWAEDVPRTLETVCRGKFFRSRGWMAHVDVKRKFRKNSQAVWEAEMECRRPMADGLYLPAWTRQRYSIFDWTPRPEFGNIWLGVDWGGTEDSACLHFQGPLRVPITIQGASGQVTIPRESYVVFDEHYEADIGATWLGNKIVAKEIGWRRIVPGFRVTARFADMAGKQQRDDWREHDPPLRTVWYLPDRKLDPMIRTLQGLVEDKHLWVDSRCSRLMDDIESWRQKNGKEVHDQSCLVAETMVETALGPKRICDIRDGDLVYTREGLRRVLWSGRRGSSPASVKCVRFSNGTQLIGTADHPIWVEGKGFVPLASVRYRDTMHAWPEEQRVDEYVSTENRSRIEVFHGTDILTPRNIQRGFITRALSMVVRTIFTGSFGKMSMDQSQSDMKSIISMGIQATTSWKTWIACRKAITQHYTGFLMACLENVERIAKNIGARSRMQLRLTPIQTKARNLGPEAERPPLRNEKNLLELVIFAGLSLIPLIRMLSGVQQVVSKNGDARTRSTTRKGFVPFVKRHFLRGNMGQLDSVPVVALCVTDEPKKQWVYDLSVENTHEFFANGILVHNSHGPAALRYGVANTEALERRKQHQQPGNDTLPTVVQRGQSQVGVAVANAGGDPFAGERAWREQLGESFPKYGPGW